MRALLGRSDDVVIRTFTLPDTARTQGAVMFVEGLSDYNTVQEQVLTPLMSDWPTSLPDGPVANVRQMTDYLRAHILTAHEIEVVKTMDDLSLPLLSGDAIMLVDGDTEAVAIGTRKRQTRGVQQPVSEMIVRGPRDGFTETLYTNTSLVRARIKDPNLQVEAVKIGRRTKTDVAIMYIKGIANPKVLNEVRTRLDAIDIDAVLESAYIEQLIEDTWYSPFPQLNDTERPDEVSSGLLEGRVAILCDNTPFALIVPNTLMTVMQSPADAYFRWPYAATIRTLRLVALGVALVLPALYVALTSFHTSTIPTELALAIAGTRQNIPFPSFIEALFLELALELLREASIRLPQPIGPTIAIVGGLIVGESAVRADLVSPIMVIVVATTALASFVIPTYSLNIAVRTLRFGMLALAGVLGLYGIVLGILILLVHLSSLKSFGVGYLEPISPMRFADWRDSFVRIPLPGLHRRPTYLSPVDPNRMDDDRQDNRDRLKTDDHD